MRALKFNFFYLMTWAEAVVCFFLHVAITPIAITPIATTSCLLLKEKKPLSLSDSIQLIVDLKISLKLYHYDV